MLLSQSNYSDWHRNMFIFFADCPIFGTSDLQYTNNNGSCYTKRWEVHYIVWNFKCAVCLCSIPR
jgi:hypothetical protein